MDNCHTLTWEIFTYVHEKVVTMTNYFTTHFYSCLYKRTEQTFEYHIHRFVIIYRVRQWRQLFFLTFTLRILSWQVDINTSSFNQVIKKSYFKSYLSVIPWKAAAPPHILHKLLISIQLRTFQKKWLRWVVRSAHLLKLHRINWTEYVWYHYLANEAKAGEYY